MRWLCCVFFLFLFYKSECTMLIFHMLNQILFPGINPIWSWYIIFYICYWFHLANILLRNPAFMFFRNSFILFFLVLSLSDFDITLNPCLTEDTRRCSLLFFFSPWKYLYRIGLYLHCLIKFTNDVIWAWAFLWKRFSISNLISMHFRSIDISIFSWDSLGNLYLSIY